MQYEYSPMQLAEIIDFSFLKEWDTIRIVPEGYNEEEDTMSTSSQAEPTFTRSKGGTAEREEIISQIQVPDLWKIAEVFQGKSNTMYMSKANREAVADAILECWHLAHDMKKHLQSNG